MNSGTYILSDSKSSLQLKFKATLDAAKLIFLLVFVLGAIKVYLLIGYHSSDLNCMLIYLYKEAGGPGMKDGEISPVIIQLGNPTSLIR